MLGALTVLTLSLLKLEESRLKIEQQQDDIEQQRELIDKKETFAAAMEQLMATVHQFDGSRFGTIIPLAYHESLAKRGWDHRWNGDALDRDTGEVFEAAAELDAVLASARDQAAGNATGSAFEATIDQLGGGFVASALSDADALCKTDALGCVTSADPYTVHLDAADNGAPWMTDWLRTGIAYHEFAHVLQFTNPEPTEIAVAAFGGDWETMADCFSLTYLPGWSLDHTIWVSDFQYWEISVGYGYVCDEPQRQTVRDWYDSLPLQAEPLTQ